MSDLQKRMIINAFKFTWLSFILIGPILILIPGCEVIVPVWVLSTLLSMVTPALWTFQYLLYWWRICGVLSPDEYHVYREWRILIHEGKFDDLEKCGYEHEMHTIRKIKGVKRPWRY